MTKVMFVLIFILQNPTGGDQLQSIAHEDAALCEYQRQWMKSRDIIVSRKCRRMEINIQS